MATCFLGKESSSHQRLISKSLRSDLLSSSHTLGERQASRNKIKHNFFVNRATPRDTNSLSHPIESKNSKQKKGRAERKTWSEDEPQHPRHWCSYQPQFRSYEGSLNSFYHHHPQNTRPSIWPTIASCLITITSSNSSRSRNCLDWKTSRSTISKFNSFHPKPSS